MTKPFIYSFPRSGLHLTSATIGKEPLMAFRNMQDSDWVKQQIETNDKNVIFYHKTRAATPDDLFAYIQAHTKPVLIARDPKDALLSLCMMTRRNSFDFGAMEKFIMSEVVLPPNKTRYDNKILMWKDHIKGWMESLNNPLVVRYENLITSYAVEAKKIGDYLDVPVKTVKPELGEVKMSRKGLIGEHKDYFPDSFIAFIDNICKDEIALIDKYLL